MEYKTISEMMMEDINNDWMMNDRIHFIPDYQPGYVTFKELHQASMNDKYRLETAMHAKLVSPTVHAAMCYFLWMMEQHSKALKLRHDDMVKFLANYIPSIPLLDAEPDKILDMTACCGVVVRGSVMRAVMNWCRDNGKLDLLPEMLTFVFCKMMAIKAERDMPK